MSGITYKSLFLKFRDDVVVDRSEQYAYWTLPYLMADLREVGSTGRVVVQRDFQEIGALLTNNLAAKMCRILFPTQYPFFKASASKAFKDYAVEQGYSLEELDASFAKMEMDCKDRLVLNAGYAALILMMKFLIVTGNVLLYRDGPRSTVTAFSLQAFAARRDHRGELLDCILREFSTLEALPPDLQNQLRLVDRSKYSRPECRIEKYTRIHREYRSGVEGFLVSEQIDCTPVGEPSWYPKNLCPWLCPTWNLIPGEHYGRGMVEDYAGGFARLSSLSESAALYGVEMSKVLHLVGAGAGTDPDDLAEAETGEWRRGDPATVSAYEAGDDKKFAALEAAVNGVFQRLAKAFMYTGIARQAERVTAYELQQEAVEAEHTLGGVYSALSGGIQVPMAHILMAESSDDALVGLVSGELKPDVTAGIPALGRSAAVQNLLLAGQEIAAVAPIAQLDKRIDSKRIVNVVLAGRSVDPTTIFFTKAEQKANEDASAAQQAAQTSLVAADTLANSGDQIAQTLTGA